MRTIKFDTDEKVILKEIIDMGNSQYNNHFSEIGTYIFNKIRIEIFHFDKKEIQVLRSYTSNWINNNDILIDELNEKYLKNQNINYENISKYEKDAMNKISIVFSIKSKLFLEKYITFKKILKNI